MDTRLKDHEVRIFTMVRDALLFFLMQEGNDMWVNVYTNELTVLPVENNPLYVSQIKEELGLSSSVTDEAVIETMNDLKLAIRLPVGKRKETFLCRYTALKSLCDRAGISGKTLTNLKAKVNQAELPPKLKAQILSDCLSVYSNKSLVLIRDGKVSAVLSGDEKDYKVLSMNQIAIETTKFLRAEFPQHHFGEGFASHDLNLLLFDLNSDKLNERIKNVLQLKEGTIQAKLTVTSSDIGNCGANIYPTITVNGLDMFMGKPKRLAHKNNASISQYRQNLNCTLALFRDSLDRIEKLQSVKIVYPADCLRVIAKELRLPKKQSILVAKQVEKKLQSASAYDMYFYVNEIIRLYAKNLQKADTDFTLLQMTQLKESAAECLYMDISKCDYPFSWE